MIIINDKYAIQADEKQYILVKKAKRVDKDGSICWDTLGYYASMPNALEGLSRRLHREKVSEADMSIAEAVYAYEDIRDSIMTREGEG